MLTEVADGVFVATSSICSTSTTIIVSGTSCVVVDPAWTPTELDALAAEIARRGWTVTAGFSTHAHQDHLLWHPGFGAAPRWASAGTVAASRRYRSELLEALGDGKEPAPAPVWYHELFGKIRAVPGDFVPDPFGSRPPVDEPTADEDMQLIVHDGHAPGHTAVWLPGRRVLLAGDMLSDIELPLPFSPDDLQSYRQGLAGLAPFVRLAEVLIPGHGRPTTNPTARLEADEDYLRAVLAGRPSADARIDMPGMEGVDEHIRELAAASGVSRNSDAHDGDGT